MKVNYIFGEGDKYGVNTYFGDIWAKTSIT